MSMDEIYQMPFAAKFLADIDRLWEVAATNTGCGSSMHEGEVQPLFDITSADELVLVVSALTADANCGLDYYKSKADLLIKEQSFRENIQNLYKEGFANLNAYDTERIEALIQWVVDTQTVLEQCWNCPPENIMSELIQLFYPLGITVPVLKACMTANVEDVKAAIGSDVINTDINNVLLQHSLAMLLQVFAAARNVERFEDLQLEKRLTLNDETVRRMNLILSAYRDFAVYTETYSKEYTDLLNHFIALGGTTELCVEKNPGKALLLEFVNNKLYWEMLLWSYFNMLQPGSSTPIYVKKIILTLLEECSDMVTGEYAQFCDENDVAAHDRLPLLLANRDERSETPSKKTSRKRLENVLKKGRPYFDKAVEKGLMVKIGDNKYEWKDQSTTLLAYFCGRIYCGDYTSESKTNELDIWIKGDKDRLPSSELNKIFVEELDLTNLRSSRLASSGTSPIGHKEIDQIIDEVTKGNNI